MVKRVRFDTYRENQTKGSNLEIYQGLPTLTYTSVGLTTKQTSFNQNVAPLPPAHYRNNKAPLAPPSFFIGAAHFTQRRYFIQRIKGLNFFNLSSFKPPIVLTGAQH